MNHNDLIERYRNGAQLFVDAVKGTSSKMWDKAPAPGKWTIRQIIQHTVDAEVVFSLRIRMLGSENDATLIAFDQDKWAESLAYTQRPVESALALFAALREANAALLAALPQSAWAHLGHHPERGAMKIEDQVSVYINHGENHARAVREAASALGRAAA